MKAEISRKEVRQDFTRARELMRRADEMMDMKNDMKWDSAVAEQIANELIAAVTTFAAFSEERAYTMRTSPMPWDK
jgi:hypothetical protein